MRLLLTALAGLFLSPLLAGAATAQIVHYDARLEGEFCLMCNLGGGAGGGTGESVTISHLDLTDMNIDMASGELSFDVEPASPVSPDELEAFVGAMGYELARVEVIAEGVARQGDTGWRFVLPGNEEYALDVPESQLVVDSLAAAGRAAQRIRARLYRNGAGEWQMSLMTTGREGQH